MTQEVTFSNIFFIWASLLKILQFIDNYYKNNGTDRYMYCEFELRSWRGVFNATFCDKVCQWLATRFSPGTPVYSTNNTDKNFDWAGKCFGVCTSLMLFSKELDNFLGLFMDCYFKKDTRIIATLKQLICIC
jgi:hypothetical protein